MDFTRPAPPALPPGVIARPQPWYRRLRDLGVRYRWEALPAYVAVPVGTAIELHAATNPDWTTPLFYSLSGVGFGVVAYVARDKTAGFSLGSAAGACMWGCAVTAGAPTVPALIVGTAGAIGASAKYWRMLAKAREEQRRRDEEQKQRDHEVELAKLDVMKAYAGAARIPGQRDAPEIEAASTVEQPRDSVPWRSPRNATVRQPVPIGPNTTIDIVGGHILIAGRTRAGKSVVENGIISTLLDLEQQDALVVGIDMKFGGVEFRPYEQAGMRVAFTPDDADELIDWVLAQARRRGEQLGVSFEDTGTIRKAWHATAEHPHIVLVIDEVAELTRQAPKTAPKLETILAVTTGLGVTGVLATQLSSAGVFNNRTDGPSNIDTVVCLGTKSPMHTRMILGEDATKLGYDAHLLEQQGEFYVRSHRHRQPRIDRSFDQTPRILEDHLRSLGRGTVRVAPEHEPEAFVHEPTQVVQNAGRLENATELATDYLRTHGPSTPQEIAEGVGWPQKEKSFDTLCRRHEKSRLFGTDGRGRYWVVGAKTVRSNIVPLATRRNR